MANNSFALGRNCQVVVMGPQGRVDLTHVTACTKQSATSSNLPPTTILAFLLLPINPLNAHATGQVSSLNFIGTSASTPN